jgi:prepilin-type N-terminal cleavage/methylation domain-containing protein
MKNNILRRKIAGFTLAELLIVITVTAILATIGFLSLSGYRKDAEVTKIQANLRSVYSAISTEAISTSRSPRYYVRHDSNMALTGGAVVVFDGFPIAIAGGEWDMPGTNYSAGNPHYEKLKLDSEKFRTSFGSIP